MVNFGAVEFLALEWVEKLAANDVVLQLAVGMQFSKRLELIQELLERSEQAHGVKKAALEILQDPRYSFNSATGSPLDGLFHI